MQLLPDHNELLIQRTASGISLIDPAQVAEKHQAYSIGEIVNQPFSVYFLDCESTVLRANESVAEAHHYASPEQMLGKSVFDLYERHSALRARKNDLDVLQNNAVTITEEVAALQQTEDYFTNLTIELPWHDSANQLRGIFGVSVILGQHALDQSLQTITKMGLLNTPTNKICPLLYANKINDVYLSRREMQCLRLYVRGKSAQTISTQLNLSRRTVEHYLENIRLKLHAKNKAELIEMVMNALF